MKQVIFSKFSNERAKAFAIRTQILEDADGTRVVQKIACHPEGREHVNRIAKWHDRLLEQFSQTGVCPNRVLGTADGMVELEYLDGADTLEERFLRLWNGGREQEAKELLGGYLDMLRACADVPFVRTEEFRQVFGDADLPDGLLCMPVTDFDMTAENILFADGENRWNLIDYEWVFPFPVPVNMLIYRTILYVSYRHIGNSRELAENLCRQEGMGEREIRAYRKMEEAFQHYVTGDHVPLRELYQDISPGVITVGDERKRPAPGKADMRSALYLDGPEHAAQDRAIYARVRQEKSGEYRVQFQLPEDFSGTELRWDPFEGELSEIRIVRTEAEVPVALAPENGFSRDGREVFWTRDPIYRVQADAEGLRNLTVCFEAAFLEEEAALAECRQTRREQEACEAELARVRLQAAQQQEQIEELRTWLQNVRSIRLVRLLERMQRTRAQNREKTDGETKR